MKSEYSDCFESCWECFVDCQNCLSKMAGLEIERDCPTCCLQCSDICLTTIKFLIADSPFIQNQIELCARICSLCAEQCQSRDEHFCQVCAETCKNCAEECERLKTLIKVYNN